MNHRLAAFLGVAILCSPPCVSFAQSGGAYSPYYYLKTGSYYEPHYYSAYEERSDNRATATSVYGDAYSPYDYLRHGSYSHRDFAGPSYKPAYYSFPQANYAIPSSQPVYYSYVQPLYTASPSSTSAATEEEQEEKADTNHATIQVRVPANAEIWFEDSKTSQTGSVRHFVSPPLDPGRTFSYDVRAHWIDNNGEVMDKTQTVKIRAGERSELNFLNSDTKAKK